MNITEPGPRRRFSRLQLHVPAILAVRPVATVRDKQLFSSMTTTLSSAGAGLVLNSSEPLRLRRRYPTTLELCLHGQQVSVRSHVAWCTVAPTGQTIIGLELLLALCARSARCAYSEWIAESIAAESMHDVAHA